MEAFKIKNGISAKRYLGSNGTETSNVEFSLSGAAYDNSSFSISPPAGGNARDVFFKTDGTKFYVLDTVDDKIWQFALSTAWDLSTASYESKFFDVSPQEIAPRGMWIKPDGTKLYVVGADGTGDELEQYSLSTAWDISTASYDSVNFDFGTQDDAPNGIYFKADGTKLWMAGQTNTSIYQYSLSTAWDVSTVSYDSKSLDVSGTVSALNDVFLVNDGARLIVGGSGTDTLFQYDLSTDYDVSTGSYNSVNLDVSAQETSPQGWYIKSDSSKLYLIGTAQEKVFQYSTSTGTASIDLSTGHTFSLTISSPTTVSFTNPPATGNAIGFSVEIIGNGSAITWPSSVKWHLATAPVALASKELYTFVTTDGGTTYYGKKAAEGLA